MVILNDSYRSGMLTNGSHHYIQPDPFVPISSAMDVKQSPLAMLQRTCSQIGADTGSSKPSITAEKKADKKETSSSPTSAPTTVSAPAAIASAAASTASSEKPTFKPYDLDRKPSAPSAASPREVAARETGSASPRDRKSPGRSPESRRTPRSDTSGSSPITRPGAEVLGVGAAKELAGLGLHKPGALPLSLPPYLSGADAASAALRPTLPGLPGLYGPSSLSAASYLGLQHHRPGEKCASPYCPCAYATSGATHGYGAPCPAGCAQCEHAKALTAAGALPSPYLSLVNPFYPPHSTSSLGLGLPSSAGVAAAAAAAGASPIVCSWMAEGRYCGKRFGTTEELMAHLRTHTNLSASDSALSLLHPAYQAQLLGARPPFGVPVSMSSMSPLSAARYHPYAKPGVGLGLPQPHPSLAAYYSPYSALYARPPTLP